ncbi:hypothetical protein GINT2_000675 [Glugoides intestinalis]
MKGIRYFTLRVNSWLIRVRNGNIDAFIQILPSIYNMLYPEGGDREEFLEKIKALSEVKLFTIGLMNKDVLYIEDGNFDTVFQVLKTIKYRFEKVIVAKKAFTEYQIHELRTQLRNGGSCTLETVTEEFLLNSWLRRQ